MTPRKNVDEPWLSHFGPEYRVPKCILNLVRQGHINDLSEHDDPCPSFGLLKPGRAGSVLGVRLWVEHRDPRERDPGIDRYLVVDPMHAARTNDLGKALIYLDLAMRRYIGHGLPSGVCGTAAKAAKAR